MHSAGTSRTTGPWNISDAGPRCGSAELATLIIRAVLTLAVLAALLLIAALPAQAQTETVLYNFPGGSDGGFPQSGLISDGTGNLYGTTEFGGLVCPTNQYGCGTVFKLSPNGNGGWNETVLYSFTGGTDGAYPTYSNVIFDNAGNLYGTTEFGGANGLGAVFELSPVEGGWTETVLHSFAGAWNRDGAYPTSGVIMDPAGNLYGTTVGNFAGWGTVFELSPSGGGWAEQNIYFLNTYSFAEPGLTMDGAGNIFGAADSIVFELSPNGNGGWNPTVLHTFTGSPKDGITPYGAPVPDQAGNVYGTTYYGGAKNCGTVYKLSRGTKGKKKGEWTEKILHSFNGKGGQWPAAGVVLDPAGNIYGTTVLGGKLGYGTVFELVAPVGKGNYEDKVLWTFNGGNGFQPYGGLILDGAGNLYGTTASGGPSEWGIVFELTP